MLPYFSLGGMTLFTYPLILGLNIGLAYRLIQYFQIKNKNPIPLGATYFTGLMISVWLGSKILFLISSSGFNQTDLLNKASFWFGGGLVFYGGLITGSIYSFFYFKYFKISSSDVSYLFIILAFTHALGRIGCFLAGCCFGVESNSLIAVHMHGSDRLPVQLIESFFLICLSIYLLKLYKEKKRSVIIFNYFLFYSAVRFFLEFYRADQIRGEFFNLSTSQWISLFFFGMAAIIKIRLKNNTY